MIREQTNFDVADNSGARRVECIRVLGSAKTASIGDKIIVAVKDALPDRKVKKGDVCTAVVVRTAQGIQRADGTKISFDKNAVVLINKQNELYENYFFGA
jgi:large subunit ribosomal protein L14